MNDTDLQATILPITALVIHCNEPQFQKAFRLFITRNLGLSEGEYVPLVIPGGVASIGTGVASFMPKTAKGIMDQIQTLLSRHKGKKLRLILFTHEGCKDYEDLLGSLKRRFIGSVPKIIGAFFEKQVLDLPFAAKAIEILAKKFDVECKPELYTARLIDGNKVAFEEIIVK